MCRYLLLQREDVGDAAVDGVAQPGLRLVGDGGRRLAPVGGGHLLQQLGRVAGAEHLVDGRELRRPVLGAEVGSEHALRRALAPQELAGATRGPRRAATAAGGSHDRQRLMLWSLAPSRTSSVLSLPTGGYSYYLQKQEKLSQLLLTPTASCEPHEGEVRLELEFYRGGTRQGV
jgi:hypothetical protein